MYKFKVNNKYDYAIDSKGGELLVNDTEIQVDIKQLSPNSWHIIEQLKSYNVALISFDKMEKTAEIRVNNNIYTITAKDRFDLLLDQMGLTNLTSAKISELKAPMPGLVLKVFTEEGTAVQKGDSLFILEAMKMENIIKSPVGGVIKSIKVKPGDKLEKGQILLLFA
ncbi:acetyl-CoA carboxylase biotin carboxyl carrier protein subunit [Mucilaginibacter ximonensis]|uniref:Acetyl-CoA carboxylase biotin carboxyl carrier protein subunit n=1 Tax=Mucilaginibacter ximonensis TaxID=538021 RepID=A0ABW5YH06_9SPHI